MFESGGNGRPSLIGWTLKSAIVVGGLSWLASGWLSVATRDGTVASRFASRAGNAPDPLTTGSLSTRAGTTRLDPCSIVNR